MQVWLWGKLLFAGEKKLIVLRGPGSSSHWHFLIFVCNVQDCQKVGKNCWTPEAARHPRGCTLVDVECWCHEVNMKNNSALSDVTVPWRWFVFGSSTTCEKSRHLAQKPCTFASNDHILVPRLSCENPPGNWQIERGQMGSYEERLDCSVFPVSKLLDCGMFLVLMIGLPAAV